MFILGYVKSILFEQLDVDATTALKICLDQDIPPDAILNQYHKIKLHGKVVYSMNVPRVVKRNNYTIAYCSETGETEYGMVVSFFTIKSRDLSVIILRETRCMFHWYYYSFCSKLQQISSSKSKKEILKCIIRSNLGYKRQASKQNPAFFFHLLLTQRQQVW